MIDEVLDFLGGKTVDVRAKVRDLMTAASERQDYERARELRDTLKWLDRVDTPAAVEITGTGDADVIGYARDGDDAVGVLLRIREGRVIGREHRFLENVEEVPDAGRARGAPGPLLPARWRAAPTGSCCPFPPADVAELEALLPGVDLVVPQRGTAARWLDLADQNARHLLESLRIESFETDERAEDPVYALGRDLGLSVVPRSLICVDISTNQGRDTVGSLVWFEAGRPKKAEYRKFKIKGVGQQDDFAAIHEVVTRYLTRRRDEGKPLPDLVVIDGGKGQLGAARAAADAAGLRRAAHRVARQAGGGGLPRRARRAAAAPAARARRSGCCSARATRPTASASPTAGSGAPSAPSPRSCSTSRASARSSAPGCSSGSAASPG